MPELLTEIFHGLGEESLKSVQTVALGVHPLQKVKVKVHPLQTILM